MSATVETTWKQKIVNSIEIPVLTRCCFCFPLRKGLIAFAYINLILIIVATTMLSIFITYLRNQTTDPTEYPRVIVDTAGLVIELIMTVCFIAALHRKDVLLMKIYMYFEIVFSVVGFVYSLAFLTKESAGELFLILLQLSIQIYLMILIWSSVVKMERDGTVKYTRDRETV